MIAAALAGPIPGSVSNSVTSAVLIFTKLVAETTLLLIKFDTKNIAVIANVNTKNLFIFIYKTS